jgi:hypothetical protein
MQGAKMSQGMGIAARLGAGIVDQADSASSPTRRRTASTVPEAGAIKIPIGILDHIFFGHGHPVKGNLGRPGFGESACMPTRTINAEGASAHAQIYVYYPLIRSGYRNESTIQ